MPSKHSFKIRFKVRRSLQLPSLILLAFSVHWHCLSSKHISCIQFCSLRTWHLHRDWYKISCTCVLSRSRKAFEAFSKVVETAKYPKLCCLLTHRLGSAKLEDGSLIKLRLDLMAWKADRLMCCFKACNVGSIFSTVLLPLLNGVLATLTSHVVIVEPYRIDHNKLFQCLKIRPRYF